MLALSDMTQTELIEKARRGERITKDEAQYSMRDARINDPGCMHISQRVIACDSDHDVVECWTCGRQSVKRCNFDDDMS